MTEAKMKLLKQIGLAFPISMVIFHVLYKLFPIMRKRYPNTHHKGIYYDVNKTHDGLEHCILSVEFGLLLNMMAAMFGRWFLFGYFVLTLEVLLKELWRDGHLRRILEKSESDNQLLDLKTDLLTRFSGYVVSGLLAIPLFFI